MSSCWMRRDNTLRSKKGVLGEWRYDAAKDRWIMVPNSYIPQVRAIMIDEVAQLVIAHDTHDYAEDVAWDAEFNAQMMALRRMKYRFMIGGRNRTRGAWSKGFMSRLERERYNVNRHWLASEELETEPYDDFNHQIGDYGRPTGFDWGGVRFITAAEQKEEFEQEQEEVEIRRKGRRQETDKEFEQRLLGLMERTLRRNKGDDRPAVTIVIK